MTGAGRLRRTASAVLVWAVLVALVALFLTLRGDGAHRPTAIAPAQPHDSPATTVDAPHVAPAPTTPPTAVAPARVAPEPSPEPEPSAPPPTAVAPSTTSAGMVSAPALAATCSPDLALEASPDAPYSFLCTTGTTPISWPNSTIRLFTSNLTAAQTTALPIALAQWQSQAHFDVTIVSAQAQANVVLTSAALSNNEDGYTSMHYVCAATCAYDHADVRLTSTAQLTKTSWITTILHELGHVAGLNHVARHSEVMYPEINTNAPVTYGSGDLAGFHVLEATRSA
ncbi:MAG TPA: matrixin family metalloprotease [Acidimicrobiales bacterium]|nr:matrixin family metalloprotease [Acidimicrobiales bacterium]